LDDAVDLSVVIPCYDEATRLPATLERAIAYLRRERPRFEILVVDDGSRDATAEVARALLERERCGAVIALPSNRGKGAACRVGALAARGRHVLLCDADLSTPIEEESRLRAALDSGADLAIGTRAHPAARIVVRQARGREGAGRVLNCLLRALGLTDLRDTQCGFKLFRRDAARALFERARIDGFLFDVEILRLARRDGMSLAEVPVEWRNDPDSRVRPLRHWPQVLWDLLRIRLSA
jgi:dolichyl-phosphate beta-glucosyltransferase